MEKQKDKLATLSPQQSNPYTAMPEDFEVGCADGDVPGHGQCGKNKKEHDELLAPSVKAGRTGTAPRATETSDARKPHTA